MEDEAGFDRWNEFKAGGIDQPVCGFFPEMEGEVGQKKGSKRFIELVLCWRLGAQGGAWSRPLNDWIEPDFQANGRPVALSSPPIGRLYRYCSFQTLNNDVY